MREIILDTCIIVDIFEKTRPRHDIARKLADWIIDNDFRVLLPIFSRFELHCTLRNLKDQIGNLSMQKSITKERPLAVREIEMDRAFFQKYFNPSLPYTKSGDLIFLSMAIREQVPLISEDLTLYKKAKESGADVYTEQEFLIKYGQSSLSAQSKNTKNS